MIGQSKTNKRYRFGWSVFVAFAIVGWLPVIAVAQGRYSAEDPMASVDGSPVFLGELNLVLKDRLKIRDLDKAPANVQQATAALLVRQHLAMISLRKLGGETLTQMIEREISQFAAETNRRGSSLEAYAKQRSADVRSLKNSLAFQVAWRQYLKSHLTDKNLRRFFDLNRQKYAGGRWDVSQLFLKMDSSDKTSIRSAEQRMSALLNEIRQSSSPTTQFAAAVRDNSDAPSASEGGHIGWVQSDGDLPSSVMKVIRETEAGSVSPPVRSPLGLHSVLVHKFEPKDLTFQDLTDQAQLRRDATDRLFHQLVRQQKDAKISWYISGLKPPSGAKLIPE